jgi:hypothetical protein
VCVCGFVCVLTHPVNSYRQKYIYLNITDINLAMETTKTTAVNHATAIVISICVKESGQAHGLTHYMHINILTKTEFML